MTLIYPFQVKHFMSDNSDHADLFRKYRKGIIKPTHKRVTSEELFMISKLFIYADGAIAVVTGNQHCGGLAYLKHCRSFEYSIDRKHNVALLYEKKTERE